MPDYGYRLYVVSLHDNRMAQEHDFGAAVARPHGKGKTAAAPVAVDYRDQLEQDVNSHLAHPWLIGVPQEDGQPEDGPQEGPGEYSGSCTRFDGGARVAAATRVWFDYGPINIDGTAIDTTGQYADLDLSGWATNHKYRASLVAAEGATRAILAVEVRGRTCPVGAIIRAMHGASDVPWRLRTHDNVADLAAWRQFVNDGSLERLELTEWVYDTDGARGRKRAELSLNFSVDEQDPAPALRRGLEWARRALSGNPANPAAEARELLTEAVSINVGDIAFNDAALVVRASTQTRVIRPSTDFRRFTYTLGRAGVDDRTFFNLAEQTAEGLLPAVQTVPGGS